MEKEYGGSLKKLKIELLYDPAIPLQGMYPEEFERYMHPNIHSSTVYNSQDLEASQALINKQLA